MSEETFTHELVRMLTATRQAERDVFGALDPETRDRPLREADWSPKDHQAHLTAWKSRQADRFAAARAGRETPITPEAETDQINAELHATRVDWAWDAIQREADAVSERLNAEVLATDPELVGGSELLIQGTFGNGAFHAQQHFIWLVTAGIGVDEERVMAFVEEVERMVRGGRLPERDKGTAIYNTACFHAVTGHPERARPLLREAFAMRSDLIDWAQQDGDLVALRDQLAQLADQ